MNEMKKIKLSYIQIRTALPVLKKMQDLPMGAVLPLTVARAGRILGGLAMDSEEARVGLMKHHADKDDKGEPIQVPVTDADGKPVGRQMKFQVSDEETKALNIEWTEALNQEVEVEIPLIPLDKLEKTGIELTPVEMMAIEPLLLEEGDGLRVVLPEQTS